jgi:hypothetical protein
VTACGYRKLPPGKVSDEELLEEKLSLVKVLADKRYPSKKKKGVCV